MNMAHPSQQNPQQFADPYFSLPQANVSHHYPYHPGFPTMPHYSPPSQLAGPGQFYYPPGGHPPLQPQSSVQMLSQELAAAQRRLSQYTDLISNLYAELETIRSVVCHNCKEKISPANLASHASFASQSQVESSQTVISPHMTPAPPIAIPFPSTDRLSFQPSLSIQSPAIPAISDVPSPSGQTENSSPPPEIQLAEPPEETALIGQSTSKKPQWSAVYNSEIKQVLEATFVHAFKHTPELETVRFSPDGKFLAVGLAYRLGRIQIYDVKARLMKCALGECSSYSYEQEKPTKITSICYSGDGRYLVIGQSYWIHIWDIANKRVLVTFKGTRNGWSADLSPDGRFLVASSKSNGYIRLWKMRDGSCKVLSTTGGILRTVKFSPNGRYVAAACLNQYLGLWDVRSGILVGKWTGHKAGIRSLAFSPDGTKLMTSSWHGSMKSWDVRSLNEPSRSGLLTEAHVKEHLVKENGMLVANEELKFDGHSGSIYSTAISPDGNWVLTCSSDRVCIWDMHTAVRQCTLEGHEGDLRAADFSPVGNYIATGSKDGFVTLWTYKTV